MEAHKALGFEETSRLVHLRMQACLVLAAQWSVLYFFYKNKIFFKV